MTKVYGIHGRTSADIMIQVGKASLPIEFTKGCLDRRNYRPATFTTDNKALQDMIEGSPMFGGVIKIWKVYGTEGAIDPSTVKAIEPAEQAKKADTGRSFPEVTTMDGAMAKLKALGAKATNLVDEASIKKFMVTRKISFPNFEF